jgi:serine/threonine protein kinase
MKKKISVSLTLGGLTSPAYAAPEALKNITTSKLDMWALGIILYQLLTSNKHPFDNENEENNMFTLINNI